MNIRKTFDTLVENEPYIDLDVFLDTYETFEEFPLISRCIKLVKLGTDLKKIEASNILISTAFFVLNSALLHMQSKGHDLKERFLAISYTNFDFSNKTEPPIPNFFVNSNSTMDDFSNKLKSKQKPDASLERKLVQGQFESCGLSLLFTFYESRFFDPTCNEDIVRVYAILN